ncbi:hypothetical protein PRZ01_15765 [Paucibacter sp. hw1]|uniref:Peptidase M28 domain-containing protein n=1 Tax=Roseateles koreensis TaxID=2987526 RepID=A0ABT5KUM6_9BURK|nr:hypothetical protein [Roseateles koreensis]
MFQSTRPISASFRTALQVLTLGFAGAACAQGTVSLGGTLNDDVRTYSDFGVHRYGSKGEQSALAWMGRELAAAGFTVEKQALQMGRQLTLNEAHITLGGKTSEAFPHWWPPEQQMQLKLEAALKAPNESTGAFAWLRLPYERGAYLNAQHTQKILEVAAHKPLAILLTIDNPAGSIFTYNVNQEDAPWPVPVIVVPARLAAQLEAAQQSGEKMNIDMSMQYQRDVSSYNVIGRIDNGAARTVVVSTPVSSWFTSSCERGPGIALFLALARHVAKEKRATNFVFVGTVGHEIGHGGMESFIHAKAPAPDKVKAWLHLGASLACYGWTHDAATSQWRMRAEADPSLRVLLASESLQNQAVTAFKGVAATPLFAEKSGIGELRDVRAAGYVNYFGMAGLHRFFHTPDDRAELTGPELLEPLANAFTKMLDELTVN